MVPLLILFASKSIYLKVVLVITQKCLDKYTLTLFCHQSSIIAWLQTKPTSASDGAIIHKSQDLRVESGSNFNDTFFMNNHL